MRNIFTTMASVIATMQCLAATTWYVAASGGNDSNDGKSPATALKTIKKAVQKAFNGDTILVSDGSYAAFTLRDSTTIPRPKSSEPQRSLIPLRF